MTIDKSRISGICCKICFFIFFGVTQALGKNQVTLFCNDVMFLLKRETP
jgi:hypothetical protein